MNPIPAIQQRIESDVTAILERQGGFLIDVQVRRERGGFLIQVFADTDTGITIEECANISRELRPALDRDAQVGPSYRLEVSSPGLEKPLRFLRQYQKNIGRRFSVVTRAAEGTAAFEGVLNAVEGTTLIFAADNGEEKHIAFDDIVRSKEKLPW